MSRKKDKWYMSIWRLLVHTITCLAHYAALAAPAFIIYKVNKWLMANGMDDGAARRRGAVSGV
jgi:hypothetical protein